MDTYGEASSSIKKALKQLGVNPSIIRKTVVSMYEAEINMVLHGRGGDCNVTLTPESIYIEFQDQGPGIPDIEMAMKEGYSTASERIRELGFGAGMGLPNIKKNSDDLEIQSSPETGTHVKIRVDLQ